MPFSDEFGKEWAKPHYKALDPHNVVDVGPGAGWWVNTLKPVTPESHWTAVEVFAPYVEKFNLNAIYDTVVVCNVLDARELLLSSDLVVFGDVIEHLAEQDARDLLTELLHYGVPVLVSVPIVACPQDAVGGNEHEIHLWTPTHDVMMELIDPDHYAIKPEDNGIGVYWRGRRKPASSSDS